MPFGNALFRGFDSVCCMSERQIGRVFLVDNRRHGGTVVVRHKLRTMV